jgi:hypothetical protein
MVLLVSVVSFLDRKNVTAYLALFFTVLEKLTADKKHECIGNLPTIRPTNLTSHMPGIISNFNTECSSQNIGPIVEDYLNIGIGCDDETDEWQTLPFTSPAMSIQPHPRTGKESCPIALVSTDLTPVFTSPTGAHTHLHTVTDTVTHDCARFPCHLHCHL